MTEQDYIDMCIKNAAEDAEEEAKDVLKNYLKPFSEVVESFIPNNMTRKEFNKFLEETKETDIKKIKEKGE